MWADHGGIDFNGRACWDAWTELKVRRERPISHSSFRGSRAINIFAGRMALRSSRPLFSPLTNQPAIPRRA